MRYIVFILIFFLSCSNPNENVSIEELIDNGVELDKIELDYATIIIGDYGFPVLKKISEEQLKNADDFLIYLDFISNSRDRVRNHYAKLEEEDSQNGIVTEYYIKYKDTLEAISIEMNINNNGFATLDEAIYPFKIIPTPDINSGNTFAKYEHSSAEFINRIGKRFPDHIALSLKKTFNPLDTYTFKIKIKLNSKEFNLTTSALNL